MKKFSYISDSKRLTQGGKVIAPEGLSKLDANSLQTAIKNKIIKEADPKESKNKKRSRSRRKNAEETSN